MIVAVVAGKLLAPQRRGESAAGNLVERISQRAPGGPHVDHRAPPPDPTDLVIGFGEQPTPEPIGAERDDRRVRPVGDRSDLLGDGALIAAEVGDVRARVLLGDSAESRQTRFVDPDRGGEEDPVGEHLEPSLDGLCDERNIMPFRRAGRYNQNVAAGYRLPQ